MKKIQVFALFLMSMLMCYSASLRAEDIDIYVSNATTVGTPNVLFVLYNGADADADAGASCTYSDGTTPSTGGSKVISLVQCSLVSAINGLADSSVNIGIAVNNANSFAGQSQATTDTTKGGYHDLCNSSGNGGCIIRKLMKMDTAGKASMTAFIKGLTPFNGGQTDANGINLKVNSSNADPAAAMQESWAYYNGKTGLSGTNYSPSILANGCQRNFVVYIGTSAKSIPTGAGQAGISAAQVGATTAQLTGITGTIKFNQSICSVTSQPLTAGDDWANEWARLMYQQDGGASGNFGVQNIITYTINVEAAANKCFPDAPGMMASMAKVGGGKFYDTTSAADLTSALNTILNEVQAVNSVFSSASLPVSVNAQGTYLNQIYLGMFRPDATASPRWLGNLKQYKLVKDSTGNLVLGDSQTPSQSAISSSGTGFISPTAVSFWTYKNTATSPDSLGGFFVNNPEGTPVSGYDSPDGEVVEKGGAAQQIRKENLTATFAGGSNTASTNPRRMYTYCPGGSSCVADLTNSANDFSTANSGIPANAFGSSTTIKITSITRQGTTATATTSGAHGFASGTTVTISNVNQSDYNGDKVITVPIGSTNTFTFTVPDYPTTPATGSYDIAKAVPGAVSLTGVTRTSNSTAIGSAANQETATVTGTGLSTFGSGPVTISGFNESGFNGSSITLSNNTGTSAQYTVQIYPTATSLNAYTVVHAPYSVPVSSVSNSSGTVTVTTSSNHGFHTNQTVIVAGTGASKIDTAQTITVSDSTHFTFTISGNPGTIGQTGVTAKPSTSKQPVAAGSIKRTGTGATATATINNLTANWFANGDVVNVVYASGSNSNESQYVVSNATISCTGSCTSISYTIPTSLATTGTGTGSMSLPTATYVVPLNSGIITRDSAGMVTVKGSTGGLIPANALANGNSITLTAHNGATVSTETAYIGSGTWTISCTSPCQDFTYGPIALTPTTPATGSSMQAYSSTTAPDRDTVIKWLRGADNFGDELGPGGTVTVRPSVHADVLHSRPFVINYGGATDKIVVYYGTNDGVFHAVNGNQTAAIGSIPAGDEMWGLVLTEQYGKINRQRVASPELKFPTTTLTTATTKDYFVDGPTGAYQKLNSDGTINTAYIYLTMRRGGQYLYALDVSDPATPKFLWKIDTSSPGFSELGQTWSRPRLTLLQSSTYKTTPVLVFGGGYDPNEDSEPPATDVMGRGIYIVNAATGALIWSATPGCVTSSTCLQVPSMTYAIPSDVTFVDRDSDGYTDKLYVGDLGGNLWRVDVADAQTTNWKVTKVAALGCDTGVCASGTTPRKFFFPPAVLSIGTAGAAGAYDAISVVSGDREHPLKSSNPSSAYYTVDRFFMIADQTTTVSPSSYLTSGVTKTTLTPFTLNSTTANYVFDGSNNGFYLTFGTGEKGVNAPLAVNGSIFFSTNQPADPSATCIPNLGTARAYAVSPFTGQSASNVLSGGGLPPSAVAGLVSITTGSGDQAVTTEERFCIGCGLATPPGTPGQSTCTGNAALQNCTPLTAIPANLRRTYWYKK